MEVDYEVEIDDVLALNMYQQRHSPVLRARMRVVRFGTPLVMLLVWLAWYSTMRGTAFVRNITPIFVVFAVLYVFLIPVLSRRGALRTIKRLYSEGSNRGVLGRRRLTITPETITQAGELSVTTVKWAAVEKIVEDDARIYFFVSAMSAFILPKAAFSSEEQSREFVETARRYKQTAPG